MNDATSHGKVLAEYMAFGVLCRFVSERVDGLCMSPDLAAATGMDEESPPFWAVYPQEYVGAGGVARAILESAPVISFGDEHDSEELADRLVTALNFFAEEPMQ